MDRRHFFPLIDGHAHVFKVAETDNFTKLMDSIHAERVGLACQSELNPINTNPAGFVLKSRFPDRFYILAGIDHSNLFINFDGKLSLIEQVRELDEIGVDGIKMLATKPSVRKWLGEPADGSYFADFFMVCEDRDLPLLWHVADPEEFWNPEKLPRWAQEQDWGYDESYLSKEELYSETENVLKRHPSLRVIFPHFYFMSADLKRAERLLEEFPNVYLDLAPGIELYYNLTKQMEKAREFFCRFAERIMLGTDILSTHSPEEAQIRAGIIYRFLAEDEIFRVPEKADFLLGPPEEGIIHGLSLPENVLNSILQENFLHLYGLSPKKIKKKAVQEECRRLAEIEKGMKNCPLEETEGAQALCHLKFDI